MNFKQWYLNEVGTSTASIAVFSLPIFGGPLATRTWPNSIVDDDNDEEKKDKKPKKKD